MYTVWSVQRILELAGICAVDLSEGQSKPGEGVRLPCPGPESSCGRRAALREDGLIDKGHSSRSRRMAEVQGRGRKRRYPQGQPLPKSPLRGTLGNQAFRPSSALSKPSLEASGPPRCNNSGPFLQKPFHFNKHRNFLLGERFANYAQLSSGEAS